MANFERPPSFRDMTDLPKPEDYGITYEEIIAKGKNKEGKDSPRAALVYLRRKNYPVEIIESMLFVIKRTKEKENTYYRSSAKMIADLVYGKGHVALTVNPKGTYQGNNKFNRLTPQPVKVVRPRLRRGTEWLNIKKEIERNFKLWFKPENYEHRYKSLDEFVSFATDKEIDDFRI